MRPANGKASGKANGSSGGSKNYLTGGRAILRKLLRTGDLEREEGAAAVKKMIIRRSLKAGEYAQLSELK